MLNKYNNFLNSNTIEYFGALPIKLNGSFHFTKYDENIYMKLSINLGYELIKDEKLDNKENIKIMLNEFINNYFTNIEKYELDELYNTAEYLIKDSDGIDEYSYLNENIITEFENTFIYDELLEKYPKEKKAIKNIFCNIYKYCLNNII